MADLTAREKRRLELFLGMDSGYVLNFSNRTFAETVLDATGKEIYSATYDNGSGSKAYRLRAFWQIEPNMIVGNLLNVMFDVYQDEGRDLNPLYQECREIALRLLRDNPMIDVEAIVPNADGREFELLAKSVRDAIEANTPEVGLDRLHTFVVKYIRVVCEKHGISTPRERALHSLFGEYVNFLRETGLVESDMSDRILRSTISFLEAYNRVRNEQTLAHDNHILSYDESLLILNNVAISIRFIKAIERRYDDRALPF